MKKIIPYGKQFIDANDGKAVSSALKNDKITTGPLVKKFEYVIKSYTKSKFALSCNSGTSALYLAFQSLELKKNDVVVMPSINFVSSYNIAKIFQAKVYLADVDPFSARICQFWRMLAEHFTTCSPFTAVTSGLFEISRQDLPSESTFAGFNTQFSLQQNS